MRPTANLHRRAPAHPFAVLAAAIRCEPGRRARRLGGLALFLPILFLAGGAPPLPALAAEPPRLLAVDDLFALKQVGDPRISPDGRWVAYTVRSLDAKRDDSDTDIYMVPMAGGEAVQLTASDKPETTPRWSPDGRYLAFLSKREGKNVQVWLLNRLGGDARRLTDYKADVSEIAWSPDAKRLALVVADVDPDEVEPADKTAGPSTPKPIVIRRLQFKRDGEGYLRELRTHIHVFDLASKSSIEVTSGPYDDTEPAWSPDGRWLAFTSNRTPDPDANENTDVFVVQAAAGAVPRAITTSPAADSSPSWSPDGKQIIYVEGGDPRDLWYGTSHLAIAPAMPAMPAAPAAPAASASPAAAAAPAAPDAGRRLLTADLDRNVSSPRFAADGQWVYFLIEEGGNNHLARVSAAGGPVERVVDGERHVEAFDLDVSASAGAARGASPAAGGEAVVLESDPGRPFEVSAVLPRGAQGPGGLRRLTAVNDELLRRIKLAPVERYRARSADGAMIDAFLTRPPGAAPGSRLPAILRIHGGPASQFSTEFHFEWQLLAAHGYAVIAANPRGSTGYGRDFSRAIWADWGNKDYEDVMAAVDQAVVMGAVDPDRLGVGGWSYGGILTNYVITKTGRFKAAIPGASEVNYLADYGTDHYQYAWETELGLPWRNVERWLRLSPWFQVEKITTPTLILCGTDDANVPALNSEQLYQALRRLGRDTELVLYPSQHHSLVKPSYVKDRYERYLAWYDKYLKAPPNK
ncbi:MAG TPA: S9 family peptidase [Thermoanaerobaculia bacterium]|nr:S9 family peptidase [Thermoanaerobaculia bacterium]